jgi:hypothetical protein
VPEIFGVDPQLAADVHRPQLTPVDLAVDRLA